MLKDLDGLKDKAIKKATKKRLRALNVAQVAGYAFSGLVLGLGILNLIYTLQTNLMQKERQEQLSRCLLKIISSRNRLAKRLCFLVLLV